jgi:hypothetical protein
MIAPDHQQVPPAHDQNVVDRSAADNDPRKGVPALWPGAGNDPLGSVVREIAGSSGCLTLGLACASLALSILQVRSLGVLRPEDGPQYGENLRVSEGVENLLR